MHYLVNIPKTINNRHLPKLFSQVDQLNVCLGYPDEHFVSMVKSKKGTILNSAGDVTAYLDDKFQVYHDKQRLSETVRTSGCLILTKMVDVHIALLTAKSDLYSMGD